MALDPIALDADPLPTLVGKVNASFARLGLAGAGAPTRAADFVGQEYLDTDSGRIHVAKAVGSTAPADDWELKVRTGDGRLVDARPPMPHTHAVAEVSGLQASLDGKQSASQKGKPSGYAGLDAGGRVPAAQLPTASGGAMNHAYANGSPGGLITATETQIGAVTITPGSATARILILARVELSKDGGTAARVATLRLRRGTQNTDPQVGPGSVTRSAEVGAAQYGPLVVLAVDAPGTTAAVTYTVRGLVSAGNSTANRFEITVVELAGAAGPQGPAGPGGAVGADGRTVRSGSGAPAAGLGSDGDFYLDQAVTALYGPKTAGAWGAAVSLVGARGPQGPQGSQGPAGATGPQGPQGPKGDAGPPGTGTGAYLGQRQIAASAALTVADRASLVRTAGSDVALSLDASGFALLDWLEVRNENAVAAADGIVTIDAGPAGINEAGRASVLLAPGDTVRLVRVAATAPMWLTLSPIGFVALEANQYAAVDAAGSAQAPRTDRHAVTATIVNPAGDGVHGGFRLAWPAKFEAIHARTRGGTVGLVVERNGVALPAFATAQSVSTSQASYGMDVDAETGDFITFRLRAIAGLTTDGDGHKGAYLTAVLVRTGD